MGIEETGRGFKAVEIEDGATGPFLQYEAIGRWEVKIPLSADFAVGYAEDADDVLTDDGYVVAFNSEDNKFDGAGTDGCGRDLADEYGFDAHMYVPDLEIVDGN